MTDPKPTHGSVPHLNGHANGMTLQEDDDDDASPLDPTELDIEEIAPPPLEVAELIASCVRFVQSRYKLELDLSPDTLSLVDQYVREARAEVAIRPEVVDLVSAAVGAYLGEVARQAFGGYWRTEGHHSEWRVLMSRAYVAFNPIGMAREALLLSEQVGWHAHFETDPAEREVIEARLAALPDVSEDEYYSPSTRFDVVQVAVEALRAHMQANQTGDVRFSPDDYA